MKIFTFRWMLIIAAVVTLSGCTGTTATTTHAESAAPPTASATTATATKPAPAPTTTAPEVAAPATPGCVPLFTQTGGNIGAATYLADQCTMDGATVALTGSATTADGRFITYPNGLTVTLGEVQRMPNNYGSAVGAGNGYLDATYALVRVDLTVTNTGSTPASLDAMNSAAAAFDVTYGNGVAAHSNPGIIDAANTIPLVVQEAPPAVVPVGGRSDLYRSFAVPVADLGTMSVIVDPDPSVGYTPFRITNLNAVMVPFKP
ncbi:hypothetical protein AAGW05_06125 [Arthrobacter sp. LAPM80]|uniref:hypothetical protein n=1 Tax=Arthrobacter sp. LAPM80 TaxID=3141788 RepID=UPI00398B5691